MRIFIKSLFLAICLFPSIIGFTSTMDTKSTEEDVQQIIISSLADTQISFSVIATENKNFTVDWGDETIETKTGTSGLIFCNHTYTNGTHNTITITGEDSECIFNTIGIPTGNITSININGAPDLQFLAIASSMITEIDLSANTELIQLFINGSSITELELSNNTVLERLYCQNNQISNINLSNNIELTHLNLSNNLLTSIDLSNNINLEECNLSYNLLDNLDVSSDSELTHLYTDNNKLELLNLNNNPELIILDCSGNQLTELELTLNVNLERLNCSNNQIANLDLSQNTLLTQLKCSSNSIESLELSSNVALLTIDCDNNLLTDLDISASASLTQVYSNNNMITLSDLFLLSEKVLSPTSKRLGTQNFASIITAPGTIINLTGQMKLGDEHVQTNFEILKDGIPAETTDYSTDFVNETLTFNTSGIYTVTMTNSEISSHSDYPAEVIATYIVTNSTLRLTDLSVSEGTLNPVFNSDIIQYYVNVPEDIDEITISAEGSDPNAIITGTGLQNLQHENNIFEITITSQDQQESLTYNIIINRAGTLLSRNANLATLTVSEGTLTPQFDPDTRFYTVTVPNNIDEITINATTEDENATITGIVMGPQSLEIGANQFDITVNSETTGITKTYSVIIFREDTNPSTNADLLNLTVSQGTLTPAFTASTLQYTVNVANNITEVTITATTDDENANVTGDGLKTLNVGANPFDIVVTAEDGTTTKTYNVTITREDVTLPIDNANLENLTVSEGTLTPAFTASTLQYTVNVANDITEVTITATTDDENANVAGDGLKTLNVGANPFDIVVTAEDGTTTKTYNVTITREDIALPSDNANLESLTTDVDGVALSPEFNPAVLEYVLSYPVPREQLTITASPEHPNATITGDGLKELLIGEVHSFDIIVTAEDGETTKTYKLKVFNGCIGVDNIRVSEFSIYPNPANEYIKVDMEKLFGEFYVKIFNAQGVVSYEKTLKGGMVHEININNLTDGVYYLQLNDFIKSFNKVSK